MTRGPWTPLTEEERRARDRDHFERGLDYWRGRVRDAERELDTASYDLQKTIELALASGALSVEEVAEASGWTAEEIGRLRN